MTQTIAPPAGARPATSPDVIRARKANFFNDLRAVAIRALKLTTRDIESVIPALVVPLFFFVVNIGQLQRIAESGQPGLDFKAFQLPVAIIFAVTGVSRASNLVTDINNGYFDRMLMSPMNRMALLLGLMVADFALVCALAMPVVIMGLAVGVSPATGIIGLPVFILLAGAWGLVFTGFPYAIALKTGSPAAVNSSFILFFPFAFLTTAFVPKEALTDWLGAVAVYNPVTYLLEALRSLLITGWDASALLQGVLAIVGVGIVSQSLAFLALRGRVKRG